MPQRSSTGMTRKLALEKGRRELDDKRSAEFHKRQKKLADTGRPLYTTKDSRRDILRETSWERAAAEMTGGGSHVPQRHPSDIKPFKRKYGVIEKNKTIDGVPLAGVPKRNTKQKDRGPY